MHVTPGELQANWSSETVPMFSLDMSSLGHTSQDYLTYSRAVWHLSGTL